MLNFAKYFNINFITILVMNIPLNIKVIKVIMFVMVFFKIKITFVII